MLTGSQAVILDLYADTQLVVLRVSPKTFSKLQSQQSYLVEFQPTAPDTVLEVQDGKLGTIAPSL